MSFLPNQEGVPKQAIRQESPSPDPLGSMTTSLDGFYAWIATSAVGMQKFNNLLVVVDTLTKQVHLVPTTKDVTAEGVAQLYFDNIYKLHGLPKAIISDRDTKFTGALWRTLHKTVGT